METRREAPGTTATRVRSCAAFYTAEPAPHLVFKLAKSAFLPLLAKSHSFVHLPINRLPRQARALRVFTSRRAGLVFCLDHFLEEDLGTIKARSRVHATDIMPLGTLPPGNAAHVPSPARNPRTDPYNNTAQGRPCKKSHWSRR